MRFHHNLQQGKLAIYIHWPFCKSKCPYCDFNSHVVNKVDYVLWQEAFISEINYFKETLNNKIITSIFFGGGTPSLMPPKISEAIINRLSELCEFDENIEITLEANPTSVEINKFADFKDAGINRVSLGVQSFIEDDLKFLGREHNSDDAVRAIEIAQKIFNRHSFDLIYARPKQTLKSWQDELEFALSIAGEHISLYQLTIEKGTDFFAQYRKGAFTLPQEELATELYEATEHILAHHNLKCYEISNYAKTGQESRHNLSYWNYDEYLGIGPGAHSRLSFVDMAGKKQQQAFMMHHNPQKWLQHSNHQDVAIQKIDILKPQDILTEVLMMGLRLSEGINDSKLQKFLDSSFKDVISEAKLLQLQEENLLKYSGCHLKLTNKGLKLHNKIINFLLFD